MNITEVDLVSVRIPVERPYVLSRGAVEAFRNVLVRIHGEDGLTGLGECDLLSVTGDTDAAFQTLADLARSLLGADSLDLETIVARLLPGSQTDLGMLAAFDFACWDLNGKQLGQPVFKLLGGEVQATMPVDYTLGQDEPSVMARRAVAMTEAGGFTGFCVKVGGHGSLELDIARVRAVREALGSGPRLRIDANGAFRFEEARRLLDAVAGCELELVEQPLPAADLDGLSRLAREAAIPISVDEGLHTLADAHRLIEAGAGVFNLKLSKVGGLHLAKKLAAVAESAGVAWLCGGGLAYEVVRQASRHFVACTPAVGAEYHHEGPGPASQGLLGNVTRNVIGLDDVRRLGGRVAVRREPGLGLEEDPAAINGFTERSVRIA